ncbi:Calsequestrin-1 [Trichinella spiralis]|uniref:Calsequestrin n=3 Tax=Trichinella spiralis TaxID=6334 RepID=A0A0V1BVT8_TRISP|nr:Calsequestrin-1 [Trichinella spiralis]
MNISVQMVLLICIAKRFPRVRVFVCICVCFLVCACVIRRFAYLLQINFNTLQYVSADVFVPIDAALLLTGFKRTHVSFASFIPEMTTTMQDVAGHRRGPIFNDLLRFFIFIFLIIKNEIVTGAGSSSSLADGSCIIFGFPGLKYDGVDRTSELNERNFNKTVHSTKNTIPIVFFSDVEADDDELLQYECFLQISAQVLERRGFAIYTVNTTKESRLRKQEGVEKGEDTIHVYKDGNKIEYFGIFDPHTFVSWVFEMPDDPVVVINSKHEEIEFHAAKDTDVRVIGYFNPGGRDLKEFEEAAEDFMNEVRCFAVVDTYWARRLGITKPNEIRLYRPFDNVPVVAPRDADTERELEDWIRANKEPVMQKLTTKNFFNVWKDPEPSERMIVAFCDEEEEAGEAVFELLKKLNTANSHYAGSLEIVLIDPDEFPLMIDEWESIFGIEIENDPQLGLVDISDREGVWFDMSQLNLQDPVQYEAQNLEVLQVWIDQIMNDEIRLGDDESEPKEQPTAKHRRKKEL